MATYREIKGLTIPYLDADPSSETSQEGSVWYNSSLSTIRSWLAVDTWATTSPGITARQELAGYGPQTAAFAVGGKFAPATYKTEYELYNGVAWSESVDTNAGREIPGAAGTQTAALYFGGNPSPVGLSEEFDGSTWTEGNNLNAAGYGSGTGTQTAALDVGRTPVQAITEQYDGTSWTEVGDLGTARYSQGTCGSTTAALTAGGNIPAMTAKVESYDGSTWTEVNALNTARGNRPAMFGTQASATFAGGAEPTLSAKTERWDGTSWSETTDMNTANRFQMGGGSGTAGLSGFGSIPASTGLTQEFNQSIITYTPATWATGGSLPLGQANQAVAVETFQL